MIVKKTQIVRHGGQGLLACMKKQKKRGLWHSQVILGWEIVIINIMLYISVMEISQPETKLSTMIEESVLLSGLI